MKYIVCILCILVNIPTLEYPFPAFAVGFVSMAIIHFAIEDWNNG